MDCHVYLYMAAFGCAGATVSKEANCHHVCGDIRSIWLVLRSILQHTVYRHKWCGNCGGVVDSGDSVGHHALRGKCGADVGVVRAAESCYDGNKETIQYGLMPKRYERKDGVYEATSDHAFVVGACLVRM